MAEAFTALLPAVVDIAERAGRAILAVYGRDFSAAQKADGTPVTDADHDAEAIILPALAELTPNIPVVSEECAAAGRTPAFTGDTFWLVDPLDGTREFVKRNDEFCVCIGLIEATAPVLGVLHGPALGVTYAAAGPGTARRRRGKRAAEPIAARAAPCAGLAALISRSHRRGAPVEEFLARFAVAERHAMGSALKFGLIAAGEADIYPRLGPTCEWDTAAGHAVLQAAGGTVETIDGGPFTYGKPGFLNPGFVARGRR